jgi:RimJ/RimL family protein N-acetyltransferase
VNRLLIRHFDHDDVDARVDLMTDSAFQRNLVHVAAVTPREELRAVQRRTIEEEYETKIIFVVATPSGTTIGYAWITGIDWVSRSCELSIALLPRYRRAYGLLALIHLYDFLYDDMNFETVVNQILVGNEMLMSAAAAQRTRQVECKRDSFTQGEFRDSQYWAQTREEHRAFEQRTAERNARIRERTSRLAGRAARP